MIDIKNVNNWSHRLPEEEFNLDEEDFDIVYRCVAFYGLSRVAGVAYH